MNLPVRIAYLIDQYPKISHSFIRREILALEQLGFEIMRISLRGWDLELVDEEDQRERTRYLDPLSEPMSLPTLRLDQHDPRCLHEENA